MLNVDSLNRTVFISDNLPFLKSLDNESIDLVVIDPPFGKSQTFTGTLRPSLTDAKLDHEYDLLSGWGVQNEADAYEIGVEFPDQSGTTASFRDIWDFRYQVTETDWNMLNDVCRPARHLIESTRYTHSDSTAAYIAFMTMRMLEVRRILKPTGSVYLHCDHEANAYLRQMMDAVFGAVNFRNEIGWVRHTSLQRGSQHLPKKYANIFDTILFYSKSNTAKISAFVPLTKDERTARFNKVDENGERYYDDSSHIWSSPNMGARPNLCYTWRGFTNPHPSGWRLSKDRLEDEYRKGNIVIRDDGRLERRKYERDWRGTTRPNLWDDINPAGGLERTGYPTQKPQALARRIIEASSNPGDMVLDCFAGCAYVPVAAELTGRRWIACDMSPRAWTVVRRQFHKQPDLRIVTEGEYTESDTGVQPDLGPETIIRVRGPRDLPERTTNGQQQPLGVRDMPEIQFRQRPVESSTTIWEKFVAEWGTECWYCGRSVDADRRVLQLDHIEPNQRDGTNDDCWNRALACAPCNSDKSDRMAPEEAIDRALAEGRIATARLRDEQALKFATRHQWAKERWESIKPRKLPI